MCLRIRDGGSLTWAAKPSVRESPDPAEISNVDGQNHLCSGRISTPEGTRVARLKFPFRRKSSQSIGRAVHLSGSRNFGFCAGLRGTGGLCFVRENVVGHHSLASGYTTSQADC